MKRKVIRHGSSTLSISLPSKWVKDNNIKKGDELDMDIQNRFLAIAVDKPQIPQTSILDLKGMEGPDNSMVWRFFTSIYRSGCQEINIRFNDLNQKYNNTYSSYMFNHDSVVEMNTLEMIQDMINRFTGMELVDNKKNSCTIKDLGESSSKEFDNAIKRIFHLLNSMFDELYEGYKTKNDKKMRYLSVMDANVDRFTDFCLRVLNMFGYKDCRKTSTVYSILLYLEVIGDHIKRAGSMLNKSGFSDKKVGEYIKKMGEFMRCLYTHFFKFEKESFIRMYRDMQRFSRSFKLSEAKGNNIDAMFSLKSIMNILTYIMQLKIDMEY